MLRVRLLGGVALEVDGRATEPPASRRLLSLLAWLALHPEMQPRSRLAARFWPDVLDASARGSLRTALLELRRSIAPDAERYLVATRDAVGLGPGDEVWVDMREFERAVSDGRREDALALGEGELLPELDDDWVFEAREAHTHALAGLLERMAAEAEDASELAAAIEYARRLVSLDPLGQESARRLMRLLAAAGEGPAALGVYERLRERLRADLRMAPSAATRELAEAVRAVPTAAAGPPVEAPAGLPPSSKRIAAARAREAAVEARAGRPVRDLPPLVGRGAEWEALRRLWQRAAEGESVLALITGEAGIGKSRLGEELRDCVARQGIATAATRCYSVAGGLAYAPVVELLRSDAIAPGLRRLGDPWVAELARLLPELLDERPDMTPPAPLIDDWQRTRLLDAVSHSLLADDRPLLLVVDDLQWCDRGTLGWLHYLLRSRPRTALLVVATARSEELGPEHPIQSLLVPARASGQAVELELGPLDRDDTAILARNVSGRDLDDVRQDALYHETEGNPLFVVERMRAGQVDVSAGKSQEDAAGGLELPPRAHAVIEARLAQLSPAGQELVSLAATVGRAFTFDVLVRASSRSEEQVVEALDELWQRRIVRERGADAYDFTHDKLREAAYRRVGSARRRMLHRRVAQALERLHGADLDGVSGQLAAHYERAGWVERSIDFYARAAAVAQRVYANEEEIDLLSRALELLGGKPPSRERDARELGLRGALGVALVVLKGYGTREVTETYARAWELSEQIEQAPAAPVVRGVGLSALTRGELRAAREHGQRLVELGERDSDPMVRVEGHYLLGVAAFWLGELAAAEDHLERAIAGYVPERARIHLALYSQDPGVVCLSRLAYALWYLGRPEDAEERGEQALRLAEQLKHPFSLGYALTFSSWLALDSGDDRRARELAERLAGLAVERELGFLQPIAKILRGWAIAADGQAEEGIAMIAEGLDAYRGSGQPLYLPWSLRLLANVCLDEGRIKDARAALSEALEVVDATGQHVFEADLHRLLGELVLAEGGSLKDAGSRFTMALDLACRQGAVPLERRAAASLERLRALSS